MSKAITFIIDTEEDTDIIAIVESVKKTRRSALIRDLLRIGWQAKYGQTPPVPPVKTANNENPAQRKQPDLDMFHDD